MLYVGVDHHTKTSHLTICDETGAVLRRKNIRSSKEDIRQLLDAYDESKKVVLEAGYNWGRMYDWLEDVADEVILAHPQKVRAIAEARIKTDKIDSETLAHLLRADLIPRAYACSSDNRANKRVLRHRMFLVKMRTTLKNRVHAILAQHEIEKPNVTDLFGLEGMNWLESVNLSEPDESMLRENLSLLAEVTERIDSTEDLMERLSSPRARGFPYLFQLFILRTLKANMARPNATSISEDITGPK